MRNSFLKNLGILFSIHTNSRYLEYSLEELLSNAVRYSDQQHISLHVTRNEEFVRFVVQDTGNGIAEADRDLIPDEVFRRAVEFGLENEPDKDKEEQWERFSRHMDEKYSATGYLRLWIPNSPNEAGLAEIRSTISDRKALRDVFERFYAETIGDNSI